MTKLPSPFGLGEGLPHKATGGPDVSAGPCTTPALRSIQVLSPIHPQPSLMSPAGSNAISAAAVVPLCTPLLSCSARRTALLPHGTKEGASRARQAVRSPSPKPGKGGNMKNICKCERWLIGSAEEITSGSYTRFGEEAAVTQKSGKRTTRTESSWRCAGVEAPNMVAVEVRILQKEPGFKGAKAIWRLQRGCAVTKDMGPGCPFENMGTTAEDKVH